MTKKQRPESLEGRWDILYRDYPEVYEEFARIPKVPDFIDVMVARFPHPVSHEGVGEVEYKAPIPFPGHGHIDR